MQIAMLGPLEFRPDSGDPRAISGARLARLLIVLALHPGEVVTTGSVVDAVWATDPPDEPANAIQALVSRLRRAAPGLEVVSRAQGYVLDVAPAAVDVREFERLVVEGRRVAPGDPASAAVTLRRALDMWRGPALVDDLYAAVRYATAAGDARRATQLVGSLGWYWWMRGHRSEGAELVKGALALDRDEAALTGPELEEQAIAYTIGALLTVDGTKEMSLALQWFDAAAAIVERIGWPSMPLLRLVVPLRRGVFETFRSGVPPADDSVGMPVDDPSPWIAATARIMRAHLLLNFGRALERADNDFRIALGVYRQLGERWGTAFSLVSLGGLAAWRGEFRTAIEDLEEALCCVTEMGAREDRIVFHVFLARLLWAEGDRDRAYATLAVAEREAARLGVPEVHAQVSIAASDLARFDGDLFRAFDHLRRAERFAVHETVASQLRAVIASSRGYLEAARGDVDEARRSHRTAIDYSISPVDAPVIAQVLVGMAEISLLDGEPEFAAVILGASAAVRGTEDLSLMDGRRASLRLRGQHWATSASTRRTSGAWPRQRSRSARSSASTCRS